MDSIVEIADVKVLNFMETRFKANDWTPSEALQTILIAFHHLDPTPDNVGMAKVSKAIKLFLELITLKINCKHSGKDHVKISFFLHFAGFPQAAIQ